MKMIPWYWLLPAAVVGFVAGVAVSFWEVIKQWMKRGGGLSGGR